MPSWTENLDEKRKNWADDEGEDEPPYQVTRPHLREGVRHGVLVIRSETAPDPRSTLWLREVSAAGRTTEAWKA